MSGSVEYDSEFDEVKRGLSLIENEIDALSVNVKNLTLRIEKKIIEYDNIHNKTKDVEIENNQTDRTERKSYKRHHRRCESRI